MTLKLIRLWIVFGVGISGPAHALSPTTGPSVILGVGEQRIINIPGLLRFSLGGPQVRALPLSEWKSLSPGPGGPRPLLLRGVQAGMTDLWVWKSDGSTEIRSIHVVTWPKTSLPPPLVRALGTLRETEVIPAGKGILLRGSLGSEEEIARVRALADAHPQLVRNETTPSPDLLNRTYEALKRWNEEQGSGEEFTLEKMESEVWIRGAVRRPERRKALESLLRTRFPAARADLTSLSSEPRTVFFRALLLELKKDRFRRIGAAWPEQPGVLQVSLWKTNAVMNFDLMIDALAASGDARILSEPRLAVRTPGTAELFSGGELPIRSENRFFSSTEWKSFGLGLRIQVLECSGPHVRLKISTEFSNLDYGISSKDVPGLRANRMSTEVDAVFGRPLFLSGLIHSARRQQNRGLPFFQDIPVLGALFGSKDYQREESELVAVLFPHRSPPSASDETTKLIGEETFPLGPVPPPRNWISPERLEQLKKEPDYPWNVWNNS